MASYTDVYRVLNDDTVKELLKKLTSGSPRKNSKTLEYLHSYIWRICDFTGNRFGFANRWAIDNAVYARVIKLIFIMIPDILTKLEYIPSQLFMYCSWLKTLTIPSNIVYIDSRAFLACGITSITIPKTVERINSELFYECKNLTTINLEAKNLASYCLKNYFASSVQTINFNYDLDVQEFYAANYSFIKELPSLTTVFNFNNIQFSSGKELYDYIINNITKANIPTLYKIGEPSSWTVQTLGNMKNPAALAEVSSVGRVGANPVFFESIQEANDFIDKYNSVYGTSIWHNTIYPAKLLRKDYINNFTKINTVAGPCLVQSNKLYELNPGTIIQKNVF